MKNIIIFIFAFIRSIFVHPTLSTLAPNSYISPTSTPKIEKTVILGLVGDLGLGRHITSTARAKKDFSWSFQDIGPWLIENDYTLANLESPIIKDCPEGKTGTFTFCGDPKFLPYLKQYKFIFNLNNNHILNYGADGLSQTKNLLSTQNDAFFDNTLIKEINGIKFAFLGYDFITYPNTSKEEIINKIKNLDSQVDYLIISIHWGNEYLPKPETWRQKFAYQMIDAGADIIHGHHPHVFQEREYYKNKPIYYSLGNFIFDQSWSYETSHSKIVRLKLSKNKIIEENFFPISINYNSQPALLSAP